jgi:CRISPR-associated endoribonuclease Cas6
MRITVTLEPERNLTLPVHYTPLVQGLVYRQIDANLASWLHGEAYAFAKRSYKLFTFSRLTPANGSRYRVEKGRITFSGPVAFTLASVNTDLLCSLAEHLLKAPNVHLGHHACTVRGVEVLKKPEIDFSKPIRVRALSPITVYQTLEHPGGGKKAYYFAPQEREWHQLLRDNLARKAKALGWEDDAKKALERAQFKPFRVQQKDQKIITYKGTVIKGWLGTYELSGLSEAYFELAYDAGLGAKNSQGFGMVEVIPAR